MTVRRFIAAAGLVLTAVAAQACVHAGQGDVAVKQSLSTSLASYQSASVESTVPTGVTNAEKIRSRLNDSVTTGLRGKSIFGDVPMSGGELTVKVTVTNVDEGNKGLQASMGKGNAEVTTTVDLYDAKESKIVGSFEIKGNSKQNGSVSVNGVDTRAMGDTTMTACDAVAEQIVDYLDKHRGSAAAKPAPSPSKDDDAKLQATFTESGQATAPTSTPTAAPTPAPVADTPLPAAAPSSCPLVCFSANKGRAAPDDEARLSGQLSNILGALRTCGNGQSSLTMRFDSSAALTEFGVDAGGNEGACVDAIRQQRPGVTYAGPATLRCTERCGGTTTTTRKRRGR